MKRRHGFGMGLALAFALTIAGLLIVALTATLKTGNEHLPPDAGPIGVATNRSATAVRERSLPNQLVDPAGKEVVDIVADLTPAVVTVINVFVPDAEQLDDSNSTTGSGIIFDDDGHVVTNAHVVEGDGAIYVQFAEGDIVEADIV